MAPTQAQCLSHWIPAALSALASIITASLEPGSIRQSSQNSRKLSHFSVSTLAKHIAREVTRFCSDTGPSSPATFGASDVFRVTDLEYHLLSARGKTSSGWGILEAQPMFASIALQQTPLLRQHLGFRKSTIMLLYNLLKHGQDKTQHALSLRILDWLVCKKQKKYWDLQGSLTTTL